MSLAKTTTMTTEGTPLMTDHLLTPGAQEQASHALLEYALKPFPGAVSREHQGVTPPVAPEVLTFRRGPLEVETLSWSPGGAKVSQRIDVWAPREFPKAESTASVDRSQAVLGEAEGHAVRSVLADGTTVLSGVFSVDVYPTVPLLPERADASVLESQRLGRRVLNVGEVLGEERRHSQHVELLLSTGRDVRGALKELRGESTRAGFVSEVGEISRRRDQVGDGPFYTYTPSRDHYVVKVAVRLEWRTK